jgi:hypothetical protein
MRETLGLYQRISDSALGLSGDAVAQDVLRPGDPGMAPGAAAREAGIGPGDTVFQGALPDVAGPPAGRALIDAARRHLADADAQLRLSLRFFEDPPA